MRYRGCWPSREDPGLKPVLDQPTPTGTTDLPNIRMKGLLSGEEQPWLPSILTPPLSPLGHPLSCWWAGLGGLGNDSLYTPFPSGPQRDKRQTSPKYRAIWKPHSHPLFLFAPPIVKVEEMLFVEVTSIPALWLCLRKHSPQHPALKGQRYVSI